MWKVKYFLFFMCFFVLTFGRFPGLVFGNRPISRYCYPEMEFCKKTWIFFILNSYKSFKTECIYKNQLWTICTNIGYDLKAKKMGSSEDHFLDFRVSLPGSRKYIREYLHEMKYFSKIFWGIAQGPIGTIDLWKIQSLKISC